MTLASLDLLCSYWKVVPFNAGGNTTLTAPSASSSLSDSTNGHPGEPLGAQDPTFPLLSIDLAIVLV
jgi:hypothetical protein